MMPSLSIESVAKWTPRVISVLIGGYYGLGIAYEVGLMALIDQVAIQVIKHFSGYAGLGALMPTVQWHAAWIVRGLFGVCAGVLYDTVEKGVKVWCRKFPSLPDYFSRGNSSCC